MKWWQQFLLRSQDKFRVIGIFRDVYILGIQSRQSRLLYKNKIEDLFATVELDVKFYSSTNVKISIEDKNGAVVAVGSIAEEGIAVLELQVGALEYRESIPV